ncbi:MAG: XRE family transcriptional regulator [Alphaproteobacteria bacterium]|nr:XRE family transcriptional regulator [Alphaproteobacteria bacterium]
MAKNINEYIKKLPKKRREKIAARAQELIAEESTLQELRKTLNCSQSKLAKKLRVNQAAVSKIERRPDMHVSTLRSFIEAMGGSLEILAQFPGSPPVRISQFEGGD